MRLALLTFAAGSALTCLLPHLPSLVCLWAALPAAGVCCLRKRTRWLAAALLGAAWALLQCHAMMARQLPRGREGESLRITGVISSLPRQRDNLVQFRLALRGCPQCWANTTVKLTWYRRAPWLKPGQRWRFRVRLKRPHGLANPGLFDYEAWLLGKGISATGYVIPGSAHRLSSSGWRRLAGQLRDWLRSQVLTALPDNHITHLLVALMVGQSSQVSAADWQTLSDTGTNHLMVISGLHIGLVAAITFRLCVRLLEHLVTSPTRWAGLVSLLVAGFYGAIAGFGLPVQRALVMAAVAFSGVLLGRRVSSADMYCYALFFVTLLDPLAVVNTGFWLSFGAVFTLLYAFAGRVVVRQPAKMVAWVVAALKTQWAVFIGMVPLLAFFVFQVSLVAFLVNLVAIPWVGILVIPLLLAAIPALAVWHSAGVLLLQTAAMSLGTLWQLLRFAAEYQWVFHAARLGPAALLLAMCGVAAMLAPRGLVPRWLGALMMLPVLATPRGLAPGEVTVKVLDVGEGLIAIVHSRGFRLVYEARPGRGRRFDTQRQIVTPMLRRFGDVHYLDALVVGEGRAPARDALRRQFVVGQVIDAQDSANGSCRRRREIGRGSVQYILLPVTFDKKSHDCVLLVKSGPFAVLLPADLDRAGERMLVHSGMVPVSVLIAARNGSNEASGPAFLNFLAPKVAIFSTGYRNRFGHPGPAVVDRYVNRGIRTYNTATDGAILIDYKRDAGVAISTARERHPRFWYE